jgi:hypothetical protein
VVQSLNAGSGEQQDPEDRIEKIDDIFRRILGRDPDESELLWAKELLKTDDLIELAHQLFCSIDFRYAP